MSEIIAEHLKEILQNKEELNPELKEHVSRSEMGLYMLRHPLVYSVPYSEIENHWINKHYQHKKAQIKAALKEKDYNLFVFTHERPYRLAAFSVIDNLLSNEQYWKLLGELWVDSENIWQNKSMWKEYLKSDRPERRKIMSDKELAHLLSLPDTFTVYRGYLPRKNKNGLSWTLDKKKAEWFANRFSQKGLVAQRVVKNSDCIAYFSGKGESEILLLD